MKTIILSLSLVLFTITIVDAQTKKIALRSHSGANSTFTIFVPDDFGAIRTSEPIERDIKVKKPKKKNKKVGGVRQCTPENSPTILKDTGNVDTPIVLEPSTAPKTKKKSKSVQSHKHKNEKTHARKAKKSTRKQQQIIKETPVPPKKSSLPLLILLLTIPAIMSFIVYLKKH